MYVRLKLNCDRAVAQLFGAFRPSLYTDKSLKSVNFSYPPNLVIQKLDKNLLLVSSVDRRTLIHSIFCNYLSFVCSVSTEKLFLFVRSFGKTLFYVRSQARYERIVILHFFYMNGTVQKLSKFEMGIKHIYEGFKILDRSKYSYAVMVRPEY